MMELAQAYTFKCLHLSQAPLHGGPQMEIEVEEGQEKAGGEQSKKR